MPKLSLPVLLEGGWGWGLILQSGLLRMNWRNTFKSIVQRKLRWVWTGLALVLGRWAVIFNFKGKPSWIMQKSFVAT
jgi:hypothetical protein